MFLEKNYININIIMSKVLELDRLNRNIDILKMSSISSAHNEVFDEFIATNNIEGDKIFKTRAKKLLKSKNISNNIEIEKRWIGIKYAHDIIWRKDFLMNLENIKEAHRALMRNIEIAGGIFKQKINQAGTLITTHPEDVAKELNELFLDYQESVILEGKSVFNIIPFIAIFLAIHPFEDGNGRLGRLIFNRMVFEAGYKFVKYISISKYIWENKANYIKALEARNKPWSSKSLNANDLIPLFVILLDAMITGAKKAIEYCQLKKYSHQEFIKKINLLLSVESLSFNKIYQSLKCSNSEASIKKWLLEMNKDNLLKTSGKLKTTKYFI